MDNYTTKHDQGVGTSRREILTKRAFLWLAVLVIIGGTIWGLAELANRSSIGQPSLPVDAVSSTDWTRGNLQAKVILVEYGDFQCPACGAYRPLLQQLEKEFEGGLLFVFRNFPLRSIHPNAQIAAQAAGAAGQQGKFWEMHDKIFDNQKAWSNANNAKDIFTQHAQSIGLRAEQFTEDLDSVAVKSKIDTDYQSGIKSGVNSTPTFYLNGKRIQPQSYEQFSSLVKEALAANP